MRTTSKMAVSRLLNVGGACITVSRQGTRRSRRAGHAGPEGPGQSRAEAGSRPGAGLCHGRAPLRHPVAAHGPPGVLHACQAAHDAVERVRKEAEKAEVLARSDAAEAEQLARQATLAVGPIRREMERARDRFLNRPLLAYDFEQHGKLTFNTLTGAFDLRLDDGPGITLSAGDLDALLAGRFKLPDIDPLQMASEAAGTRGRLTSNYAEVQAKPRRRARCGQRLPDLPALSRLGHARTALGRLRQGEPQQRGLGRRGARRGTAADSARVRRPGRLAQAQGHQGPRARSVRDRGGADSYGLVPATGPVGQDPTGRIHAPARISRTNGRPRSTTSSGCGPRDCQRRPARGNDHRETPCPGHHLERARPATDESLASSARR